VLHYVLKYGFVQINCDPVAAEVQKMHNQIEQLQADPFILEAMQVDHLRRFR
jgi:hypothetical protein